MPDSISQHIADEIIGHNIDLMRYTLDLRRKVLGELEVLAKSLEENMRDVGLDDPIRETVKWRRMETLLKQTQDTIRKSYGTINRTVDSELVELADIEASFLGRTLSNVVTLDTLTTAISRRRVRSLVSDILIEGSPARDWWGKQAADLQHRFASQIRQGVLANETNDQIVRRIRGGATGKYRIVEVGGKRVRVREFAGGIMDISTREANALVRTAVQAVANDALEAMYKENDDLVKGYQAIVTLDSRTSDICMARSGALWDLEGNPLPDSPYQEPYPGPPPWHFNCRSVLVPIVKSWDELNSRLKGKLAKEDPGTRASMDGQVAANLNYEKWLRTKPDAFQRRVLGPGRYKLWKEGKLRLADLVDPQGKSLTLDQLREKASLY